MTRTDSLFFRALEPEDGWVGQRTVTSASQRARMLDAIARAVAQKGYARVTVGDVVADAGVSRRTFYEQFKDKEACFLAAYATGTEALIRDMVEASLAFTPDADWRDVLEAAIDTYVTTLADDPEFARTFLVDVLGAGPAAVELRRQVYEQFVQQYVILARRAARQQPELGEVPEIYLRALVGGIGELVQQHVLTRDAKSLVELRPVLVQLVKAVIQGAGVPAAVAR
ncbi:MAG TPA: TetR/AcrR family transcriptional regulator [Thermoleophilaceae bacterium]|nr:TetR/AcrR family transcriptional regulator [Thermoleophilaceae bacterium]